MQAPGDCPAHDKNYKTPGWCQNHLKKEHPNCIIGHCDTTRRPTNSETEGRWIIGSAFRLAMGSTYFYISDLQLGSD